MRRVRFDHSIHVPEDEICFYVFDAPSAHEAAHEDGLVAEVQRHAWEAHGMALSQAEALLLACQAELDQKAASRIRLRSRPRSHGRPTEWIRRRR
jgi:hypothetical protein